MVKTPPEKLAYIKAWREKNRDRVLAYRKKWNDANKEMKNAWERRDHAKNPIKYRTKVTQWQKRNPEKLADIHRARHARVGASGYITAAIVRQLRTEQPNCRICGAPSEHLDHIIPKCHGGTNDRSNLQMLCASCNCRKAVHERTRTGPNKLGNSPTQAQLLNAPTTPEPSGTTKGSPARKCRKK